MSQQYDKRELAKARFITGETIQAIADGLEVSRRTVERWAAEPDEQGRTWRDLKQSAEEQRRNVVNLEVKKALQVAPIRNRARRGSLDELETVEGAIACLAAAMEGDQVDMRSLGGLAGGLVRLLEYRRKIAPPTAADLAEQVLGLGITPQEFVAELKKQWQLRA